jgi:hypothetical protein
MSAQINPYAPPAAHVADIGSGADPHAEAIRQEHIKHETSVRSVGILYYLSSFLMVIGGIGLLALGRMDEQTQLGFLVGLIYLILGALSLVVARGIRQLKPWARKTCIVLSAVGLLGFPIGTLINGYILYLMLAAKGKRVFEPDYPAIITATPHIKYRTSIVVWLVLALLLIGVAAAIVIPMLNR